MDAIFQNNPDIEWSCLVFKGFPMLVLQATGPVVAADWLQREFTQLELKYTFGLDLKPTTFLCVEGGLTANPLLASDLDPLQKPVIEAVTAGKPWLLILQFTVAGQQQAKMFITEKGQTKPFGDPRGIDHWMVQIA